MTVGIKYDAGKPNYDLIPVDALEEVAKVFTYGAAKYSPNNWMKVENAESRYISAAMRHVAAYRRSYHHTVDDESGLSHLAHAVASLLFLLELSIMELKYEEDSLIFGELSKAAYQEEKTD